jgi:hypothetical protein
MTIQLEEGKFYRTRDGRKAGPVTALGSPGAFGEDYGAEDAEGFVRHYHGDGQWWPQNQPNHANDLVAEWTDEPAPASIPEMMQDLAATEKVDVKAEIADEAKRIVTGARRSAYGTPENNFGRIARLWNSHLVNVGILDADVLGDPEAKGGITPGDVSLMMALMKVARLAETPDHRDSYVDLVGYALTGAEVNGVQPLTLAKSQA